MTPAIDTVDGHGLSNEVHRDLLPKKTKVTVHIAVKDILPVVITNKLECFCYKSGHAMR